MNNYEVAEKFISINGEGPRAGELAVFIRFKGCNLCCSYCDTKWANSGNCKADILTLKQLMEYIISSGVANITLTGGEPLLQNDIDILINSIIKIGKRVEIETNGSISIQDLAESPLRPTFTMDYKLPISGMESQMNLKNFNYLTNDDTVKFVVGDIHDLDKAKEIIENYKLTERCHIYLSPVFGKIDAGQIVEFMKIHQLNNVRLQLQMHKYIWDPLTRGV